jgi:putative DNA-invertase from lambdoid prophage Rac
MRAFSSIASKTGVRSLGEPLMTCKISAVAVCCSNASRVSVSKRAFGGDIANGLSKLFYTIAVAFAEAERDRIRERVLGTKADQKKRGRFLGGTAPFGWQVGEDGILIEVPEQQATIRKILKLRQEGLSLRAIAASIGGAVSHATVKSILSNQDAETGTSLR